MELASLAVGEVNVPTLVMFHVRPTVAKARRGSVERSGSSLPHSA